jgi:hypothetical protein
MMPGKGKCEHEGCHLARERRWRSWTDEQQAEDDRKRSENAKRIVGVFREALDSLSEIKRGIKEIESGVSCGDL